MKIERKNIVTLLVLLCNALAANAQMQSEKPDVYIYIDGNAMPMTATATQTEVKKGWDIQGFNVGRKQVRYLDGAHAVQLADRQPRFAIYPQNCVLSDYAIIRLDRHKRYRKLPNAEWTVNAPLYVEIGKFKIANLPDMGFEVTPAKQLDTGEYILINLKNKPVNEYGDLKLYDFSIK